MELTKIEKFKLGEDSSMPRDAEKWEKGTSVKLVSEKRGSMVQKTYKLIGLSGVGLRFRRLDSLLKDIPFTPEVGVDFGFLRQGFLI